METSETNKNNEQQNAAANTGAAAAVSKETITHEDGSKTVHLSGGKVAEVKPFKGKHVKQAQRLIDGDSDNMVFAMIALLTSIDGKPIVMEDLDELPGGDVLKLMGEFGTSNF